MKCYKRLKYINNFSNSQVCVEHHSQVIYRNISRNFMALCVETPHSCTSVVHQYGIRKSTTNICNSFLQ